jgi:DnaJ like chaperone protein
MRITESPLRIPSQYFYPLTITLLVFSFVGAYFFPDSNALGAALLICFAFFTIAINYLGRLTGIGSRIRTQNLLKLSAELIKVDNRIDEKEKVRILNLFLSDFPKLLAKKRFKKFEVYLTQKNDLKPVFKDLRKYPNRFKIELIRDLVKIAISDKFLSLKEEEFLEHVVEQILIPNKLLESILSLHFYVHENKQKNSYSKPVNYSLNKSYSILGIELTASIEEIKKTYRELAKIYHPDKVRDKKLKENAKQQFQAITDAYETIKKEKG